MKMTLKNRLLLSSFVSTLLVVGTFLVAERITDAQQHEQTSATNIAYTQALWSAVSSTRFDAMENESKALTRSRDVIKAVKTDDRDALREASVSPFNRIRANGVIDGLAITNIAGDRLLTMGRKSASQLPRAVGKEKKVRRTLVLDEKGQPALAVAFPLYSRGKPKGVAMYLLGLPVVADQIAANASATANVLGADNRLLYSNDSGTSDGIDWSQVAHEEANWQMLPSNDRVFATTVIPLTGFDGGVAGKLALQRDSTQVAASVTHVNRVQALVILAVVAAAIFAIFRQMTRAFRPLTKAAEAMSAISRGDLSVEVRCHTNNEISEMLAGMQNMRDYLRGIIGAIHEATGELNQVTVEAGEIAERSVAGATEQKHDTESVATAMTEMASTVHSVAENAQRAAEAARNADGQAQQGQTVVTATVNAIRSLADEVRSGAEAIERVRQESDAIGQILDVIRGIAEQTNLLALNAAIEAARAGEQGRGFAVVADEVRTLASRTQTSTTEIQSMIERLQQGTHQAVGVMDNSRQRAEESETQVQAAGDALDAITQAVSHISEMNSQIASAAAEQGRVAEEINRNVINISEVAEQTVVGAGQTTAANERITGLAGKLQQLVGNFRV